MRRIAVVLALGVAIGLGLAIDNVDAETAVGFNLESRTVLALRVGAEVQSWLPAPWQVNPAAGALEGCQCVARVHQPVDGPGSRGQADCDAD